MLTNGITDRLICRTQTLYLHLNTSVAGCLPSSFPTFVGNVDQDGSEQKNAYDLCSLLLQRCFFYLPSFRMRIMFVYIDSVLSVGMENEQCQKDVA